MEPSRVSCRLRFSLRSVLAMISLAAVGFTYLARQDAIRRQLITDIEDVGGTVEFDESNLLSLFKSQRVSAVTLPQEKFSEIPADRLKVFNRLTELTILDFHIDTGTTEVSSPQLTTDITRDKLDEFDTFIRKHGVR